MKQSFTQSVLRYPIVTPAGKCVVANIPFAARVLRVAQRPLDGQPSVWALVPSDASEMRKRVCVAGAGHELPAGQWNYVCTFEIGVYVFCAFEEVT